MLFTVYKHRKESDYTGPIGKIIASDQYSAAHVLNSEVESDFWHYRCTITNDMVLHHLNDPESQRYVSERIK
jgi:hypothetical protein